jgi:hypothetical protein
MQYKVISVRQPYAAFICAGIKEVENRTWKTDYRGKLLIHASGDPMAYPAVGFLPEKFQKELFQLMDTPEGWNNSTQQQWNYSELLRYCYEFYGQDWNEQAPPEKWLKDAVKQYGYFLPSQAIIGEVELIDIYDNKFDADSDFCEDGCFYWKLANPVLYEDKEIINNVLGHLRLWTFETDRIERINAV